MSRFYLQFENENDHLTLEFDVYNTDIATKWFNELSDTLSKGSQIREPERIYQFNNGRWTEEYIVDKINQAIDVINSWSYIIDVKASVNCSQDTCNSLHKWFEIIRGGILTPATYYTTAPANVKKAIEEYNVFIHTLEDFKSIKKNKPRLVVTFENFRRLELADSDFDHFSLDTNFGEVYINYCEVGKPLIDVYDDNDDVVGDHNIRPLKYYSSEMAIYFYNTTLATRIDKFWEWWDVNHEHLSSLGFTKYDKKLAIGKIPVAKLVTNLSDTDVVNNISKFTSMHRAYI